MKKLAVAIDGPAGAGKSTVAQIVARRLGYTYIDTGAMYRAVTWQVMRQGIDLNDEKLVVQTAKNMHITLSFTNRVNVFADGTDVTDAIREREVSNQVSAVAKLSAVRELLCKVQQEMGASGAVVMDGRDIGTHVLPHAEVKIFMVASLAERAKRRVLELKAKGGSTDLSLADIEREIAARDAQDSSRAAAPLVQAADAVVIDTTDLTIEATVQKILAICEKARNF